MNLLVLLTVINTIQGGKLPSIGRYLSRKSVNSYEAVVCSELDALTMSQSLGGPPFRRISQEFKTPRALSYKTGIYVDGRCELNLKSILLIPEFAWGIGFSWLIHIHHLDEAAELFDGISSGIFSDVVLLTDDGLVRALKKPSSTGSVEVLTKGAWSHEIEFAEEAERLDLNQTNINGATVFSVQIYTKENLTKEMQDVTFHPGIDSGNRNVYAMNVLIADLYNFRLNIVEADKFGSLLADGHFDGLMGMLERRQINLSLTTLLPVSDRLEAGYVTMTLQEYSLVFALKQPKKLGTYHALILEFSPLLWTCILITIFTGGVVLSITQYAPSNIFCGFIQAVASFTYQGLITKTNKCSSRTASVTLLICGALVLNYYGASAVTSLLSPSQIRIRDLTDLLQSKLKLFFLDAVYLRDAKARNRILLPQVKDEIAREMNFRNLTQGVDEIRRGGSALCAEHYVLYRAIDQGFLDHEKCDLTFINVASHSSAVGYIQKNPHFRELMMRGLLRIQEHGLKQREHDRWIGEKPHCLGDTEFIDIHLEAVSIAFLIYATGLVLSSLAVIIELATLKKQSKDNSTIPSQPSQTYN